MYNIFIIVAYILGLFFFAIGVILRKVWVIYALVLGLFFFLCVLISKLKKNV